MELGVVVITHLGLLAVVAEVAVEPQEVWVLVLTLASVALMVGVLAVLLIAIHDQ
jgi:hypothetical protein